MNKVTKIITTGDTKVFYFFNNDLKCKILDAIMPIITNIGGAILTISSCLAMILFGKGSIKDAGVLSAASLSSSHALVFFLKKIFTRQRPYETLEHVNISKNNLKDYSFPSGHTTAAFSICTSIALVFPHMMVIFVVLAFLIGLSRIYLGVHYPTDVLVGMSIGTFFAFMCDYILVL